MGQKFRISVLLRVVADGDRFLKDSESKVLGGSCFHCWVNPSKMSSGLKIPLPPALPYVPHYPREVELRGISFRCLWMNEEEEKCHKLKSVFFLCMALSV